MEVYTVNLEEGMPYVDEALEHLEKSLRRAKNGGCKVVKFIHGYGSSGKGGKIRRAVRLELERKWERGELALVEQGERFSLFDPDTQRMMRRHFFVTRDSDMGRNNLGVTLVMLK